MFNSLLYNENVSLKEVVKDLKKEIIDLKNKIKIINIVINNIIEENNRNNKDIEKKINDLIKN